MKPPEQYLYVQMAVSWKTVWRHGRSLGLLVGRFASLSPSSKIVCLSELGKLLNLNRLRFSISYLLTPRTVTRVGWDCLNMPYLVVFGGTQSTRLPSLYGFLQLRDTLKSAKEEANRLYRSGYREWHSHQESWLSEHGTIWNPHPASN